MISNGLNFRTGYRFFVNFAHSLCVLVGKKSGLLLLAGFPFMAYGQAGAARMITLETLLDEMVTVEEMARYPVPYYSCRQESSHDPRTVSPDSAFWFGNNDGYNGGNFIRVDTIQGRIEKVMLDVAGPGAVTRFWITSLDRKPVIRFYFDGAKEAQWVIPAYDMTQFGLAGADRGLLIPHTSYSADGSGGSTSFFPVPYANGCKITVEIPEEVEKQPRYYQINYRVYEPSARVETFSKEAASRAAKKIEEVNRLLLNPIVPEIGKFKSNVVGTVKAGESIRLNLPSGERAVYETVFRIHLPGGADYPKIMRQLVFTATFDGTQTILVPLSDFSGGGAGAPAVSSWFLASDGKGTITSRWLMPYRKNGHISLRNNSTADAQVSMEITAGILQWDDRSLYFHASWKKEDNLWLSNCNDDINKPACREWNFATISGRGVYKGDVLTLFNHSKSWYGEGDEKIWVDGETFPSHLGTGTEDYYNSSWAPVVLFQTPFGGAPRADSASSHGYNTFFRTRNLDGIPFRERLEFDLELLSWFAGTADYASTVYWYGDKHAKAAGTAQIPSEFAGAWSSGTTSLAAAFDNPPMTARPSCFWWWFNSLVDKEGITRDLEEFRASGMGSVTLVCSGNDYGVADMPRGPAYLSPEWLELFRHALREASRLGLEVGVNFGGGGWCMGGSWIPPELNSRWFVQSELTIQGPQAFSGKLPVPDPRSGYKPPHHGNVTHYMTWPREKMDYRVTAAVAFHEAGKMGSSLGEERIKWLDAKSNRLDGSLFVPAREVMDIPRQPWQADEGDRPIPVTEVIDLTSGIKPDGTLDWEVPPGNWTIITTGHVATGADVRCVLPEVGYVLEIDWLNKEATDFHFKNLGELLIREAGPLAGTTMKYFHTDSFEDGYPNWTDGILKKFMYYRGYDPTPYLPVFTGRMIGSAEVSDRFLYDYRKTVADCFADGSYGRLAELSHPYGINLQSEAAGPSWSGTVCMDGLKNLGRCDLPMGEFWMDDGLTRNGQNLVGKQTASAAHIYGRKTASAESFTGGEHWQQCPGTLKPVADRAFCEGINRLVFHTMTSTRPRDGLPGYEYGAGTHFNPNVTWWQQAAGPWLSYVNRCQVMLQAGRFVADVLFYNGDWAPNLVEARHTDPSLGRGYDYDVCNAEVLLTRLSVRDGRIILPDGMSYRLLVLPDSKTMPVGIIRKIRELAGAGATVVGPKPESDPGLLNYPQCDEEVRKTAAYLWGEQVGDNPVDRHVGKGRIINGKPLREILNEMGIQPDFLVTGSDTSCFIDYIHRSTPDSEIYFLVNRKNRAAKVMGLFRVQKRKPELWDPVSGTRRSLPQYRDEGGLTSVALEFGPFDAMFIVFPKSSARGRPDSGDNFPQWKTVFAFSGPWNIRFNSDWLYPSDSLDPAVEKGLVRFDSLTDWSRHPNRAIRNYSGSAAYSKKFDLSAVPLPASGKICLNLGKVRETARIRLNGTDLGVVWCYPWRTDVTDHLIKGMNTLEIEVVNLWPNRLIGDSSLPASQRKTKTNVISYNPDSPLLPSGLMGPITLQVAEN